MRFLRTASTARLIAAIAAVLVAVSAGAAIAVAAVGSGPVARPAPLADAVHTALAAPRVAGVSADITFTETLIDSTDLTGQASDPLLQGASAAWTASASRAGRATGPLPTAATAIAAPALTATSSAAITASSRAVEAVRRNRIPTG
jgi:hypothetical protein